MLQLSNETPFAAERSVQLDPNGVQHWVVVVKATYRLDRSGALHLHAKQEPVCVSPLFAGEEGASSLLRENEISYSCAGTDVVINGSAHAPGARPTTEMEVRVAFGTVRKILRVVGERKWTPAGSDLVASSPLTFVDMPLAYERAYGGTAQDDSGAIEPRNPVGRGFGVRAQALVDQFLPNVEDPAHPIRTWRDRPPPAGLGAVASHWSPRRELAGTFGESWQSNKLPLWPDDFNPLFFSVAAAGMRSATPLQGGERVVLEGLTADGSLSFNLPREVLMIDTWLGQSRLRQTAHLQRVIIEPDESRLMMVWASILRCGTRFREIARSRVDYKPRVAL
jgi:hypothetical protein